MKIWHVSDTHGMHDQLTVPDGIDMVIHSGDTTNHRNKIPNSVELWKFIEWFKSLQIKHKVLVAGNHDSAIEGRMVTYEDFYRWQIHYLENNWLEIEGFKIWGSPVTPTFNDWCFMMARHKTGRVWNIIPDDTDIVVTHGPPKYVLDMTENRDRTLEQVGCKSLYNRMVEIQPKLHCFGHVHNFKYLKNSGTRRLASCSDILFSNASCVTDAKFHKGLTSHGNIINL